MAGREEDRKRFSPESREEDDWSFPVPDEITDAKDIYAAVCGAGRVS